MLSLSPSLPLPPAACRLEDPYWGVGLDLVEEPETRKYFPASNSSRDVRDRLMQAAAQRGVTIR